MCLLMLSSLMRGIEGGRGCDVWCFVVNERELRWQWCVC